MLEAHRVYLFDERSSLVPRVIRLVESALDAGGTAVVFARPDVLDSLCARAGDRLWLLDANEIAVQLVRDGRIDRDRFRELVGGLVAHARAVAGDKPVHIYGEVVDVLWQQHDRALVTELEQLWSELARGIPFVLACGYDLRGFRREELPSLHAVCGLHGHDDVAIAALEARARTLEGEIEGRQRLEHRMHMLLALSSELASASSAEEVMRLAVHEGIGAVGAVSSTVWLLNGDRLELAEHSARTPGQVASYRAIELTLDAPVPHVARTGEPIFYGSLAEYAAAYPTSHDRVAPGLPAQMALALLPLTGATGTLGVIIFTYDHERTFLPPDRAFKTIFARQCALAIERVQLQAEERARRREAELLYEVTAAVNSLDNLDAIYELALDAALRASASQRAAILVFDAQGTMRFKAWRGLSDAYRRAVDGHSPWKPDDHEPSPVTVEDTETDPQWADYRDTFRAEGIRALAFVPLVHQHRLIGKLMLYRDEPHAFSSRELQLTSAIAIHVAQAIERTRAYREEREAHHEAEEATRAREEILSVVSHDLRNPLGTILMGASALLGIELGDKGQRVRTIAGRVHRQAERMARLIEDLVDFAGIQSGRLSIERGLHTPDAIVAEARDLFGPIAAERGLELEAKLPAGMPRVECDSERVVQLISNLVSNALKVTPKGGKIAIGAETKDREVVFYVSDTGPGIDPEDLPRLFERYWRSKTATYKGAGLGLSIARGIVDAHGGRIWAESTVGAGSTFFFALSSAGN